MFLYKIIFQSFKHTADMSAAKKILTDRKLFPRDHFASTAVDAQRTLVVDNGAGRIKYGWSTDCQPVGSMPNALAKIHKTLESVVGDEIDTVTGATSQLRFSRPFDRGYLVNWNVERDIWHRMLSVNLGVSPTECNLVLTVPPFCPEEIQQDTNEVLFEEMAFSSVVCKPAAWFSSYHYSHSTQDQDQQEGRQGTGTGTGDDRVPPVAPPCQFRECNVVVDVGFSFSHCIPFMQGRARGRGARRVDVGGKLLTNYLKEVISYRQWNFMDEFVLVDQVKDELCFVSQDFTGDLARCRLESPDMRILLPRCPRPHPRPAEAASRRASSRGRGRSRDEVEVEMDVDDDDDQENGNENDDDRSDNDRDEDEDSGGGVWSWVFAECCAVP